MYTLAYNTTGAGCSVVLLKDRKDIDTIERSMDFGQAEALIPEIKNILDKNSITMKDVSLLVVCVGPGSFTGVRAGISAARSFGIAVPNMTVLGVNSFEGYAHSLSPEDVSAYNLVVIETKREDFYYQIFDKNLAQITPPSAGTKEEIIKQLRGKHLTITGDGVERFLFEPTGLSLDKIFMPTSMPVLGLAHIGIDKLQKKEADYPKPLYIRAPDVCLK
ncbi:MAG: tRNA (adenosine(37)-N6)-threonylcarbamoyltransferase complex dimerization subunit type 1 TsaB [Lactobacillus sp.]|jgi:tRNA threonylcarbamoyladenosine biosynthesis protein TsaB|nr:tRNA (adenosine(37)-N6)-threonylcarbamoyltransferase complex dimerization subunit type 1 TsaB [Lactobacillus sp.]